MKVIFAEYAWEDYLYWHKTDKAVVKRIHLLIKDIQRDPFSGLGKPEVLRFQLSGYHSRRISTEHRMVYRIAEGDLLIAALRYHYED
jgi:toxin YoeB